jgi:plastocyanin
VVVTLLAQPGPGAETLAAQSPDAETGRIEGLAVLSAKLASQHRRVRVYTEPGGRSVAPPAAESPLENVIIYLEAPPGGTRPTAMPAMHQHEERFVPHVLPVLVGTTVEFPNDDPIFHSVFSLSSTKSFDLGRYPRGESKSVTFPRPGVVQVFCHIHADMSAVIMVLDNPFFTVPDSAGRFTLDDVPPGDYRLVAWHERIRPVTARVRVEAGRTSTLQVSVPLSDITAAGP